METLTHTPVNFTSGAIAEIKRLMQEPSFDNNLQLRVGVKGGGCSGMTYILGVEKVEAGDVHFLIDNIPCKMNPIHELYIYVLQLDWHGGLNSRGFTFSNPNATKTCGCGTSFSV